ncbi:large neutral amino acids transporter small subunit 1-like [Gordionus sp. m RMFG-2023]|uniref:large neutral amino acids transporter small subunit 1-like n=1 Tax=Gordionus sp. m RMFG-2023 TaxID=3053472 RepID=UPI0031FC4D29
MPSSIPDIIPLNIKRNSSLSPQRENLSPITLKKSIGLSSGVAMIVGTVIGSGIFVSPSGVVKETGSSGSALIVWAAAGLFCGIGAKCYAELGTSILRSGGDYAYSQEAFGSLPAFLYLWSALLVIIPAGNAIIALTFANYLVRPFISDAFEDCATPHRIGVILISISSIGLLTFINCYNVRWATRLQNILTMAKLGALAFIMTLGLLNISKGKYEYLKISTLFKGTTVDIGKLSLSFYSAFFSYSGWNYLNFALEEINNPYKNLPRAINISIPLITIVYLLTNISYFTVLSPFEMETSKAVAVTFAKNSPGSLTWIIQLFVSASTLGSLNGCLFTSSRLFFVGARARHLPECVAMININKFSPIPAILFTALMSILMCIFEDILALINYLSFVESVFVGFSVAALLWLRFKNPEMYRPIKVNLILPVLFFLMCIFLVLLPLVTSPEICGIGLLMILAGIPIYYCTIEFKKMPKWIKNIFNSN